MSIHIKKLINHCKFFIKTRENIHFFKKQKLFDISAHLSSFLRKIIPLRRF